MAGSGSTMRGLEERRLERKKRDGEVSSVGGFADGCVEEYHELGNRADNKLRTSIDILAESVVDGT